jgi:hypothetical protein
MLPGMIKFVMEFLRLSLSEPDLVQPLFWEWFDTTIEGQVLGNSWTPRDFARIGEEVLAGRAPRSHMPYFLSNAPIVDATAREVFERHHVQAEYLAIDVEGERMWIANVLAVLKGAFDEELSDVDWNWERPDRILLSRRLVVKPAVMQRFPAARIAECPGLTVFYREDLVDELKSLGVRFTDHGFA